MEERCCKWWRYPHHHEEGVGKGTQKLPDVITKESVAEVWIEGSGPTAAVQVIRGRVTYERMNSKLVIFAEKVPAEVVISSEEKGHIGTNDYGIVTDIEPRYVQDYITTYVQRVLFELK